MAGHEIHSGIATESRHNTSLQGINVRDAQAEQDRWRTSTNERQVE